MDLLPRIFEIGFLAVIAVWTLGSLMVAFGPGRVRHRLLRRCNHGLWFANWTVFGSGRESPESCFYPVEFRDRRRAAPAPWVEAISGRPWVWHAALWQPGRRIADRLHRIGQDLAVLEARGGPPASWLAGRQQIVARHLDDVHPRPAGTVREIRIRMVRSVIAPAGGWGAALSEDRVLTEFTVGADGHGD